jgi:ribosome maturation factor RimP
MQTKTTELTERDLYRQVARTITAALPDVEVLALELTGDDRFCVYVDHSGGVDHALCERVTATLRDYLERYSVEVSSPGSEPPLRTEEHFRRAIGQSIRVKTTDRRYRGAVTAAGTTSFLLVSEAGVPADIPYDAIVRANLIEEG